MTVGVAGLVERGGFGSFAKAYGLAGASLVEAEIVTADGEVRIANACSNPDLFWALKGGGGAFGVVTRVTLRTHALPEFFGAVFATVQATSDDSYRRLVAKILEFYREALFNPHWGEQIAFAPDRVVAIAMVFQGLDQPQAEAVWRPFFDWASAAAQDFVVVSAPKVLAVPARHFWDPSMLRQVPGLVIADDSEAAAAARSQAAAVEATMNEIRKLLRRVASYVWETDTFQPDWQDAFWGENYARLRAVKDKVDPAGLFFVHHGVGSEGWSADGFTRLN